MSSPTEKRFDAFLHPRASLGHLYDYRLRRDILSALTEQLSRFSGTFLDVGCGLMPYKSILLKPPSRVTEYLGIDVPGSAHGGSNLTFENTRIPLPEASIDSAMATEVLEHCARPDLLLREVHRVLKPDGFFFFTVPFLWPFHEVPADFYRFTPFAIRHLTESAGFNQVDLRPHSGWDGSLAQALALWIKYRGMRPWKRTAISFLLRPLIQVLNRHDQRPTDLEAESTMVTGLSGTAIKS